MAPEIAFEALKGLKKGATVMDPMVGSGTVLRTVSELGYSGIGFDIDPLAVLMSKAWTNDLNSVRLLNKSNDLVSHAKDLRLSSITLPWIDHDPKTVEFIKF